MGLRCEFAFEVDAVEARCLAVKGYVAASLMSYAAEAPEEVEMPECAVELAVGEKRVAKLFLLLHKTRYILVAIGVGEVCRTKETAYKIGSLRNLNTVDCLCHNRCFLLSLLVLFCLIRLQRYEDGVYRQRIFCKFGKLYYFCARFTTYNRILFGEL